MTTEQSAGTWDFLTERAYALSSYALTCVALNGAYQDPSLSGFDPGRVSDGLDSVFSSSSNNNISNNNNNNYNNSNYNDNNIKNNSGIGCV